LCKESKEVKVGDSVEAREETILEEIKASEVEVRADLVEMITEEKGEEILGNNKMNKITENFVEKDPKAIDLKAEVLEEIQEEVKKERIGLSGK